ncbi:hypothetical protein [Croceibacter atlanticus]|jgi:glycosyltransferase involved in cell wall biosynthesis|uniref:hypothetical protein n=1 Tax=Croceibacter atlanticus TaxID=313588 RepID=UPI0030F76B40
MRIVIISKNCYPSLGPRSHRTTELAKEFSKRGHDVTIYALLGNHNYTNISLETGIVFKSLGTSKLGVTDNLGYYNKSFWAKLIRKCFSKWLEIPNFELVSLVRKALSQESEIDYLITIAHPHTIHWGVANYIQKNKSKIKFWVADCGDPYMNDPFNKHPWYFSYYEKKWNKICDYITVPISNAKNAYYKPFIGKLKVIPQGFNFNNVNLAKYKKNKIPTFAFAGNIYPGLRDIVLFLDYLLTLNINFHFIIYVKNPHIYKFYKDNLGDKLEIRKYIPREKLLFELSKMDFLINVKNISNVQQPSKLIDYTLTKRPILEISSHFSEQKYFNEFVKGDYTNQISLKNIDVYNIRNVVDQFLNLNR